MAKSRACRSAPKVKTGCGTCRTRRIKCDEDKPFCQRCVKTGRTCDGYSSLFRICTTQPSDSFLIEPTKSDLVSETEITSDEINLLNRYFSTKTIFDVKLDCSEEARQLLRASLTDPPIRYAVSALRALRKDYETFEDSPGHTAQQTSTYSHGLEQYTMALAGLASNLSSPSSHGLKSALLCCQIFVSIEQVQGNFAAMAQHIVRGLKIMHEYRARPTLTATNNLLPPHYYQLPLLDVFVIKLFAVPCKFADPPDTADTSQTSSPASSVPSTQSGEAQGHRKIAPDMQTELTRIAVSTLEFLDKVSRVASVNDALQLLSEKKAILNSLQSWLVGLERVEMKLGSPRPELISVSFRRLFHLLLKIVLLGTLDSSHRLNAEMQTESGRFQSVANGIDERLKAYQT